MDSNAVQFNEDGSMLAILINGAAQKRVIRLLTTKDWTIAKDIGDDTSTRVVGRSFLPEGKYLVTARVSVRREGDSLSAYDISSGNPVWGVNLGQFSPVAIAISPDGKKLAIDGELVIPPPSGIADVGERIRQMKRIEQVHVVDLSTHAVVHSWNTDAGGPLAWSADSNRLAIVGASAFEIYDANTGERKLHLSEPGYGHQNVRFSPDARFLIDSDANGLGTGHGLHVWDTNRAMLLQSIRANIWSIALSRDSKFLATGEDGDTRIWQIK